jgi:hypothetical protein
VKSSQEHTEFLKRVVVVAHATEVGSKTEGLFQAMSQVSVNKGEIKG